MPERNAADDLEHWSAIMNAQPIRRWLTPAAREALPYWVLQATRAESDLAEARRFVERAARLRCWRTIDGGDACIHLPSDDPMKDYCASCYANHLLREWEERQKKEAESDG